MRVRHGRASRWPKWDYAFTRKSMVSGALLTWTMPRRSPISNSNAMMRAMFGVAGKLLV